MSVFEKVKSYIKMLDAAKYYGAKVSGSGLINCIFHSYKHQNHTKTGAKKPLSKRVKSF